MNKEEKQILIQETLEYARLIKLNSVLMDCLKEALYSTEWDFTNPDHYDGCTGVDELHYNAYPPDCLIHDFHWKTGRGGIVADSIFKDIMKAMGRSNRIIKKRYKGVRLGWMFFYKWKHKLNGNVQELTNAMKVYKILNL
jgi:hypothetical protein